MDLATMNGLRTTTETFFTVFLLVTSISCSSREDGESKEQLPARRRAVLGLPVTASFQIRPKPLRLAAQPGLESTVTDKQLVNILCSALPLWSPPTVPSLIHELKVWGPRCEFTKELFGSIRHGPLMVDTLLSDRLCKVNTTEIGGDFLFSTPYGIRVVLSGTEDANGLRAEGHVGQLAMVMGEAGITSDHKVETVGGKVGTLKDVCTDLVLNYSPHLELEFTAVAMALWLPPNDCWLDQHGTQHNFSELMHALCARPPGSGACGGGHLPYAITIMLRVDEQESILTTKARNAGRSWLRRLSAILDSRGLPGGGWNLGAFPFLEDKSFIYGDENASKVTITGHHLEWIAWATPDLRPSTETVSKAVMALNRSVQSIPDFGTGRNFKKVLPCSHAARAVAALRGVDAFLTWKQFYEQGAIRLTDKGYRFVEPSER